MESSILMAFAVEKVSVRLLGPICRRTAGLGTSFDKHVSANTKGERCASK